MVDIKKKMRKKKTTTTKVHMRTHIHWSLILHSHCRSMLACFFVVHVGMFRMSMFLGTRITHILYMSLVLLWSVSKGSHGRVNVKVASFYFEKRFSRSCPKSALFFIPVFFLVVTVTTNGERDLRNTHSIRI